MDNGVVNSGSRSFVLDDDLEPGEYQFYIEDAEQNIWEYGDTFQISAVTTGIRTISNPVSFFYDPVGKQIRWDHSPGYVRYQLYDVSGRLVVSTSSHDRSADLSGIPNGLYILRGGDGSIFKFVKY